MTTASEEAPRRMSKRGRKGGSVFPRIALQVAVGYARKLVSKTRDRPQSIDIVYSKVVGAKSGKGNIRISALRQYGFLIGNTKSNFSSGDLAKKIVAASSNELVPLYRQAMLKPTVFKALFDTYHGDTVPTAKLEQFVAALNVHPDETRACIDVYIAGMTAAGLVNVVGDQISHAASSAAEAQSIPASLDGDVAARFQRYDGSESAKNAQDRSEASPAGPRAVFNVNVMVDSNLDIEKLQRQLELLKNFGVI